MAPAVDNAKQWEFIGDFIHDFSGRVGADVVNGDNFGRKFIGADYADDPEQKLFDIALFVMGRGDNGVGG